MKLLHTSTLQVHQAPLQPPPYAALSYSWGGMYPESTDLSPAQLQSACTEARHLGLEWLWIQNLCVDHSSSAEISESINSRFRIFQESAVCLAYLGDVSLEAAEMNLEASEKLLRNSRWLRWIWTLTDLIASREVLCFDKGWKQFGTKTSLLREISHVTGIDLPVLEDSSCLFDFSVGRRMSWASACSYNREEDLAYALIGLFGVSMAIIYGEGHLAFLRLQDEISKSTDDASLFCWQAGPHTAQEYRGLLAHSPAEFSHFASVSAIPPLRIHGDVQFTSAGVVIKDVSVSHSFGSSIVLPLYSEDGIARYGMYFRSWKGFYVKPYLGFTHLDTDISQTVRRICIARYIDPRTSRKIFMDLSPLEIPELSAGKCDNAFRGQGQKNAPLRYFGSNTNRFSSARSYTPSTEEPSQDETSTKTCTQRCGPSSREDIDGSVWRANSPASLSIRDDPAGCIAMKDVDTSTIGDCSTSEHDSPPPDDDMYIFDNLPSSPPALDSGHEFTLVKDELTDYVKKLLHGQVKPSAKRSKLESPISRKRKRQRTSIFWTSEEAENCSGSDPDATFLESIPKATTRRTFSCPFYLHDRIRHRDCLKSTARLRNIKDVKQHLWHAHRQPPHCSICHFTFRTSVECYEHIRAGRAQCKKEPRQPTPEGISEAQVLQLAKRPKSMQPDELTWFSIWEVLFPGEDKPRQPFLNQCGELEAEVCRLHTFWSGNGDTIITEFLRLKGLRNRGLKDEERNLAALHTFAIHKLTDELLSGFTENQGVMDSQGRVTTWLRR